MLEGDGLELWFQQNHIPDKTRSLISAIRLQALPAALAAVLERLRPLSQQENGSHHSVRKPPRRTGRHLRDGAQRFGPGIFRSDSAD